MVGIISESYNKPSHAPQYPPTRIRWPQCAQECADETRKNGEARARVRAFTNTIGCLRPVYCRTADEATEEPASDAVKKPYDTIYQFRERRLWASPSGRSALTRLYGPRPLATE